MYKAYSKITINRTLTAKNLVYFRKKYKLSIAKLGKMLGISKTAICNWEQARAMPTIDNLCALSVIYGTPIDALCVINETHNHTETFV